MQPKEQSRIARAVSRSPGIAQPGAQPGSHSPDPGSGPGIGTKHHPERRSQR